MRRKFVVGFAGRRQPARADCKTKRVSDCNPAAANYFLKASKRKGG